MINVPLAKDKTVGPSQELVFLGIHLSTINMMAKLPDDKLQCYNEKLENLLHVRTVKLSTMQSVIGCLQFATNVVLPGKAFVRRLLDTVIGISKPFHYVTITAEARADIRMWHLFFKFHNGKTLFLSTKKENSLTLNMYSDASKMACAATFNSDWFVIEFPSEWQKKNIAFLEFYPIVVAIQIFGIKMANRYVNFHCDNKAIVQVINKQSCKDGEIMKLTRQMVLTAMQYNINFSASHVPGKFNNLADALSRLQVSPQLLRAHGMREQPVQVPQRLQPNKAHVNALLHASVQSSTTKQYNNVWNNISSFVVNKLRIPLNLPLQNKTVGLYISHLHLLGLRPSTIQSHLSAISHYHKIRDLNDPTQSFLISKLMSSLHKLSPLSDNRLPVTF